MSDLFQVALVVVVVAQLVYRFMLERETEALSDATWDACLLVQYKSHKGEMPCQSAHPA